MEGESLIYVYEYLKNGDIVSWHIKAKIYSYIGRCTTRVISVDFCLFSNILITKTN